MHEMIIVDHENKTNKAGTTTSTINNNNRGVYA